MDKTFLILLRAKTTNLNKLDVKKFAFSICFFFQHAPHVLLCILTVCLKTHQTTNVHVNQRIADSFELWISSSYVFLYRHVLYYVH